MILTKIRRKILRRYCRHRSVTGFDAYYNKVFAENTELRGLRNRSCPKEKEWLQRWNSYGLRVSPLSYRIFSHYVGPQMDLAPLELIAAVVEPVLCPPQYSAYYGDKNMFDHIYSGLPMPTTLLHNIGGIYYDNAYRRTDPATVLTPLHLPETLVVKPANAYGGEGVLLLQKTNGYRTTDGDTLSPEMLEHRYGQDFIVQTGIAQSDFMAQFNPSSVNTVRVATYRDVHTGEIHPIGAMMRMGSAGAAVDNVHAGGRFVGVDVASGRLGCAALNEVGETAAAFNGVSLGEGTYCIPHWDRILGLATAVAERNVHHRLLALDIALDVDEQPLLVEANVESFGAWVFQFTSGPVFGAWTQEIFDYCYKHYQLLDALPQYYEPKTT